MLPVVVVGDRGLLEVVLAGARRAGSGANVVFATDPSTEGLLEARGRGADVVVLLATDPHRVGILNRVRALGGRALPALELEDRGDLPQLRISSVALLTDGALLDVNVAVPSLDDATVRRVLWDQFRDARIEERHHLVEVDGKPALTQLGVEAPVGGWGWLAAGAAGVLAGRLAAADRRWQPRVGSQQPVPSNDTRHGRPAGAGP
jgi:hypothetical protein